MTFKEGVLKARSHIVFILGLAAAFSLVVYLEKLDLTLGEGLATESVVQVSEGALPARKPVGRLSPGEETYANIAWRYFENNTQPETGLVNSVDGYPSTTLWDQASYLLGLISAYRLEIIEHQEFESRLTMVLRSLAHLPLFDGQLPNKAYDTRSLEMTNYANEPSYAGIGWSALDIARIMVPLNVIVWNYPEHSGQVARIVANWHLEAMLKDGELIGSRRGETGAVELVQEGRVGYEEYAARTMGLMGYDSSVAALYHNYLAPVEIYGFKIPTDSRTYLKYQAHNHVVSEPYILAGLEFGWDYTTSEFAYRIYGAQEARFRETGVPTAVSEDNVDRAPYFVYNTVFSDGKPWNAISEGGEDASELRTVSTKAVFGWHALYGSDYTSMLMGLVEPLNDSEKGWYSGRYENTGAPNRAITANSNGIILESLHYLKFGPLVSIYEGVS